LFPFASLPTPVTHTSHVSSNPTLHTQFEDILYSPILLPNHGAAIGQGARHELLDSPDVPAPGSAPGSLHGACNAALSRSAIQRLCARACSLVAPASGPPS
jgi:hypothetical protein